MIEADLALWIIIAFLGLFGVVLPILDAMPGIRKLISLRWSLVVVLLGLLVGAIIDFSHLGNDVRFALVVGVLLIAGLYLLIRSLEKMMVNGWSLGIKRVSFSKGDLDASVDLRSKNNEDSSSSKLFGSTPQIDSGSSDYLAETKARQPKYHSGQHRPSRRLGPYDAVE